MSSPVQVALIAALTGEWSSIQSRRFGVLMKVWYWAIATTVATLVLLGVGGTVNPTGSSLACPDWPTCYGTFFPEMTGGVLFEHSHRIAATVVGFMTCILAVSIWRSRPPQRRLRVLAVSVVALVIFQGVLGGLTVIFKLPTAISTAHLAIAMGFFSFLIYLTFLLWPGHGMSTDSPVATESAWRPSGRAHLTRRIAAVAALAVYVQILLGALVRHMGAGLACPDIPFCHGALWSSLGPAQLHMAHRYAGVLVAFMVVAAAITVLREIRMGDLGARPVARVAAHLAPWLVVVQVGVGLWMVARNIHWVPATVHLVLGATLLGSLLVAFLGLGPMAVQAVSTAPDLPIDEAGLVVPEGSAA